MKRILIFIAIISLILISCSIIVIENLFQNDAIAKDNKVQDKVAAPSKVDEAIKAVTIKNLDNLNLKTIQETGFNMIVLQSEGVRRSDGSYSTSFKILKRLNRNVSELEKGEISYFIELTSGPGFSEDSGINSIFSSSTERMYFAQMLGELAGRYINNEHFAGISIDLQCPNIREDMYYSTLADIIARVRKQYPDLTFIINLHPLAYENKLVYMPELGLENVIINLPIEIRSFSYPGTSSGIISEFEFSKNTLLKALQSLKESDFKRIIVTPKLVWTDKTDVFLQDLFEINKMLGFSSNMVYGNSNDLMNFTRNETIIKLIKRHNQ